MKIAVHSDLHYEYNLLDDYCLIDLAFDVLILAGDVAPICLLDSAFKSIRERVGHKPIVFVPGNHEFYGYTLENGISEMKKICKQNDINFLYRSVINIDGVMFVGCTLWSNMCAFRGYVDPLDKKTVTQKIADFRKIDEWSVDKMIHEAKHDYDFIKMSMTPGSVIVTHFPPSIMLNDCSKMDLNILSSYFYNNYNSIFDKSNAPNFWIYGHTHLNLMRCFNNTLCTSNQHGYKRENQFNGYNQNFILEI
jgi:predicted phosphodiesterase